MMVFLQVEEDWVCWYLFKKMKQRINTQFLIMILFGILQWMMVISLKMNLDIR